jgi:mRNA-degrading endonuclease YafQ of YafQ-DinJ toxin-antitoxin module
MRIEFSKNFEKEYRNFSAKRQNKIDAAIELFLTDSANRALRTHALKGNG